MGRSRGAEFDVELVRLEFYLSWVGGDMYGGFRGIYGADVEGPGLGHVNLAGVRTDTALELYVCQKTLVASVVPIS